MINKFTKKVFLKSFGCQMNVRDSEVIIGLLKKAGYKIAEDEAKADAVIFNTCSVRQLAEEKVWSAVGRCKAKIIGIKDYCIRLKLIFDYFIHGLL